MNRTQNVLAIVTPSFLVTKASLLCLGAKSISEVRIVRAQESACEDGKGLGRKASRSPVDGSSSVLVWVQNALELVFCGVRALWTFLLTNPATLPLVALPLAVFDAHKVIKPSAGVAARTKAFPYDAGGSGDDGDK